MKVIPGGISANNQMSLIRDTEEVVKFLEFAGKKLILDSHAVNCRLTACHNLFAVVNDDEDDLEFLLSNLDLLVNRLRNKNKGVNESTLKVYKSRLKSTLEDYKAWAADPFAWEKQITQKSKVQASEEKRRTKQAPKVAKLPDSVTAEPAPLPALATHVPMRNAQLRRLSLPIRIGHEVEITLPSDGLTLKELQRIGLFLIPYCKDVDQICSNFPNFFPALPN